MNFKYENDLHEKFENYHFWILHVHVCKKKIRLKKILSIVLNVLNKLFCLHFSKCYQ